jgi:hypothetical protein
MTKKIKTPSEEMITSGMNGNPYNFSLKVGISSGIFLELSGNIRLESYIPSKNKGVKS